MLTCIQYYKEAGRKEGRLDGRLAIIARLKKSHELDCEEILRLLHISESQIQEIKKKPKSENSLPE